jgi:anthranilate phosphoribosyltransferase
MLTDALAKLRAGIDLTETEAGLLLSELVAPHTTDNQRAAVLMALREKGEVPTEVAAFATAMRAMAVNPGITDDPSRPIIDLVGTGGDASGMLNISTAAALLTAAAAEGRLRVVKHGNRAISSASGAADVLAALGVPMPLPPATARALLDETGFTFLFAPHYHPATAAVSAARKQLGGRTIFNLLGPLTNPAAPRFGVIGAYSPEAGHVIAPAFSRMPIQRVFVVYTPLAGACWDEATTLHPFQLLDVTPGNVSSFTINAGHTDNAGGTDKALAGGTPAANAATIRRLFGPYTPGNPTTTIAINAGLALEVAGVAPSLAEGVEMAVDTLQSGKAARWLVRFDQACARLTREAAHA